MLAPPPVQTYPKTDYLRLEDYIRLSRNGAFEVIEGGKKERMAMLMMNVFILKLLAEAFRDYEKTSQQGESFTEAPYVVEYKPGWVAGPSFQI